MQIIKNWQGRKLARHTKQFFSNIAFGELEIYSEEIAALQVDEEFLSFKNITVYKFFKSFSIVSFISDKMKVIFEDANLLNLIKRGFLSGEIFTKKSRFIKLANCYINA